MSPYTHYALLTNMRAPDAVPQLATPDSPQQTDIIDGT
jgi:hypothetical protein